MNDRGYIFQIACDGRYYLIGTRDLDRVKAMFRGKKYRYATIMYAGPDFIRTIEEVIGVYRLFSEYFREWHDAPPINPEKYLYFTTSVTDLSDGSFRMYELSYDQMNTPRWMVDPNDYDEPDEPTVDEYSDDDDYYVCVPAMRRFCHAHLSIHEDEYEITINPFDILHGLHDLEDSPGWDTRRTYYYYY